MSFQRKTSKRLTEIKFSRSEIYDDQPSQHFSDRMSNKNSTLSQNVGNCTESKFHRSKGARKDVGSNFFKRMNTLPLNSSLAQIGQLSERVTGCSIKDLAKTEPKIEDVIKSYEAYVKIKKHERQEEGKTVRNHRKDSRRISSLFSDNYSNHQEINQCQNQNIAPNQQRNISQKDLKYLPMHDILNYQGEVTSNPKLIQRRALHKVKRAFMGK